MHAHEQSAHTVTTSASTRGTPIVSVSLGATRDFVLQTRAQPGAPAAPKERRVLALGDGDACVMDAGTQEHYKH